MSSCWTRRRRHVFLLNKRHVFSCWSRRHVTSCWTRRHVSSCGTRRHAFLRNKKMCLLCGTRTHVVLCNKKTFNKKTHLFLLNKKTCPPVQKKTYRALLCVLVGFQSMLHVRQNIDLCIMFLISWFSNYFPMVRRISPGTVCGIDSLYCNLA